MKRAVLKTFTLTALTCLALSACGGGGGGGSGGSSTNSNASPPSQSPPPPDSSSQTGSYSLPDTCTATPSYAGSDAPTDSANFLSLLNSWGQGGWRYLGNNYFSAGKVLYTVNGSTFTAADDNCVSLVNQSTDGNIGTVLLDGALLSGDGTAPVTYTPTGTNVGANGITSALFERDGSVASYAYALPSAPANATDFLTQLNDEGQYGYQYQGEITLGGTAYALYRQDAGSTTPYSYITDNSVTSAADFVTQANGHGTSGYWFVGTVTPGGTTLNLYAKNSASTATYAYETQPAPADAASFVTQANTEGKTGYRAWGAQTFGSDTTATQIYIQDQTQSSAVFTFDTAQPQQTTTGGFVLQSNDLVTASPAYAYYADLSLGGATNSFYFEAQNCKGFLCSTQVFSPLNLSTH